MFLFFLDSLLDEDISNFDSTGMFYYTSARKIDDAVLVRNYSFKILKIRIKRIYFIFIGYKYTSREVYYSR